MQVRGADNLRCCRWLAAMGVLGLAACTLGPRYTRPDVAAPAAWRAGDDRSPTANRATPATGLHDGRRTGAEPGIDPVHDAGGLPLPRSPECEAQPRSPGGRGEPRSRRAGESGHSRTANEILTARSEMMAESPDTNLVLDPVALPTSGRQENRVDAARYERTG